MHNLWSIRIKEYICLVYFQLNMLDTDSTPLYKCRVSVMGILYIQDDPCDIAHKESVFFVRAHKYLFVAYYLCSNFPGL